MNTTIVTTILQVPIKRQLRDQAVKAAYKHGFSSLQEAVRLFLVKFAAREIDVSFSSKPHVLSKENEARYAAMVDEVRSKKVQTQTFTDGDDIMQYLST